MAKNKIKQHSQGVRDRGKGYVTYGGIKDISVLDPLPGEVGLTRVVSISVQPSPLNPQLPIN